MTDSGQRLTSWKEIAAHLGRDVRTVMRWEKERTLPIHRGPGGKRGVVFADTAELDAWMRGPAAAPEPVAADRDATPSAPRRAWYRGGIVASGALALALGFGGWQLRAARASAQPATVVLTHDAVIARKADGSEIWRYAFAAETISPPFARQNSPIEMLGNDGALAAVADIVGDEDRSIRSGQLLWFDPSGQVKRSFSFDDRLSVGSRDFAPPWVITDYQVSRGAGQRSIAITGHHYEWWPSIVTILDADWRRTGSFVNAGWIEHVRWLPGNRLAIAGFSNARDGGMVALLDAGAINGQSPSAAGRFECAGCGHNLPLRYVVMPRSEVNRLSAAPFNRASLSVRAGALLVRTLEQPVSGNAPADAEYEFNLELELVHAAYSDRYWEAHKELERLGRITHSREACPERDGPRQIEIWEPATGWRTQPTRGTVSR